MAPSPQEEYANNLWPNRFGLPVYKPLSFEENSGRVGDIAFFSPEGSYQCLVNAFDTAVTISYHSS
jgi:hypothetical protein